jgi:hypothetical protein
VHQAHCDRPPVVKVTAASATAIEEPSPQEKIKTSATHIVVPMLALPATPPHTPPAEPSESAYDQPSAISASTPEAVEEIETPRRVCKREATETPHRKNRVRMDSPTEPEEAVHTLNEEGAQMEAEGDGGSADNQPHVVDARRSIESSSEGVFAEGLASVVSSPLTTYELDPTQEVEKNALGAGEVSAESDNDEELGKGIPTTGPSTTKEAPVVDKGEADPKHFFSGLRFFIDLSRPGRLDLIKRIQVSIPAIVQSILMTTAGWRKDLRSHCRSHPCSGTRLPT